MLVSLGGIIHLEDLDSRESKGGGDESHYSKVLEEDVVLEGRVDCISSDIVFCYIGNFSYANHTEIFEFPDGASYSEKYVGDNFRVKGDIVRFSQTVPSGSGFGERTSEGIKIEQLTNLSD